MKTVAIPTSSFSFREYSLEDYPTAEINKGANIIAPLRLLLKLINDTDKHLQVVQSAIEDGRVFTGIIRGRPVQKQVSKAIALFRAKTVNAEMVLCNCYQAIDKAFPEIRRNLTAAAAYSERMLASIDNVDTFPPNATELRKKRAQQIKTGVLRLIKYIATLKAVIKEELATIKMQTKVDAGQSLTELLKQNIQVASMEPMLEAFKSKGWHVAECYETEAALAPTDNGLELSRLLLQSVGKSKQSLLPDDTLIGVIRFPTIIRLKSKLQDIAIKSCLQPQVGYSLYKVFGAYLVVDHALAIGINRSIMRVYNEKGNIEIDVDKFDKLLPYVMNEFPDWKQHLKNMLPALPVHASGKHYYSLMLPKNVVAVNGMQIGEWQFLQQKD